MTTSKKSQFHDLQKTILWSFAITSCLLNLTDGKKTLPTFVSPCGRSSTEFNDCVKNNTIFNVEKFGRGLPDLGISSLDPLNLEKIKIESVGLKLLFNDVILTGLADGRANDFKINQKKKKSSFDYVANVTLHGNYKIDGRVLILPVRGNGPFEVDLTNLHLLIKYNLITYTGDDGKDYWKLDITKRTYKLDKAFFRFENLFEGNRLLADPTLRFINENWDSIMSDIAPPIVDDIMGSCLGVVNKFFETFPIDVLSTP